MTFPVQTPFNVFACNGVQTVFAYTFMVEDQPDNLTVTDEAVYLIVPGTPTTVTKLTNGVDYTLSSVGNVGGGNLTSQGGLSPFANGAILVVLRNGDLAQDTTFPNQGYLPTNIEAQLDYVIRLLQQTATKRPEVDRVSTVASLPVASTVPYTKWWVTDATVATFGATPAGGGTLTVPVYSDGAVWRMG
jgi:hypothetical protein